MEERLKKSTAAVETLKEELLKAKKAELKKLSWVHSKLKRLEARKRDLQRMIGIIKSLSSGRDRMVRFFNDLENAIPSRVWLYQLELKGERVSMKGYAMEDRDVADFIENVDRLREVGNCKLGYIKRTGLSGVTVKDFTINTFLRE
jgi:type IV pilus assembly protein PilN